jgi:1-pyrroline-5-carboxylate dehydrogenase
MTAALPRVTYSNIAADFTPLHDWLDEALPKFRGRDAGPRLAQHRGQPAQRVGHVLRGAHCPIDRDLLVARLVAGDDKAVGEAVAAARAPIPRGPGGRGRSAWR